MTTGSAVILPDDPSGGGGSGGCGISDTFTRTVATVAHATTGIDTGPFIGMADCGTDWDVTLTYGGESTEVDGTSLLVTSYAVGSGPFGLGAGAFGAVLPRMAPLDTSAVHSFTFALDHLPGPVFNLPGPAYVAYDSFLMDIGLLGESPPTVAIGIGNSANDATGTTSFIGQVFAGSTSIPNAFWQAGRVYTVSATSDGVTGTWTVTDGVTAYSYSTPSPYTDVTSPWISLSRIYGIPPLGGDVARLQTIRTTFDTFDIPEITRCTAVPPLPPLPPAYGPIATGKHGG